MSESATSQPEVVSAGELLIDLISTDFADSFEAATEYRRLPGGSPANMAANLTRLGKRAALVATVGQDGAGNFLRDYVTRLGLGTAGLRQVDSPTTLILVTRSREVSQFEAYRSADVLINAEQLAAAGSSRARLFHTTCFALSREPARSAILEAAAAAAAAGVKLSIDANYAARIWPDRAEARRAVARYISHGALVKFSEVDYERLYGEAVKDPATAARRIHDLGAGMVCLTLGAEGCYVDDGRDPFLLESRPVDVKDTTGAGDAFWAGFLAGWLEGRSWRDCARHGRSLAELKLTHFGPLPERVSLD